MNLREHLENYFEAELEAKDRKSKLRSALLKEIGEAIKCFDRSSPHRFGVFFWDYDIIPFEEWKGDPNILLIDIKDLYLKRKDRSQRKANIKLGAITRKAVEKGLKNSLQRKLRLGRAYRIRVRIDPLFCCRVRLASHLESGRPY